MKQNDWTDKLHDSLADHQEPVPADLWSDIEARLGISPKPLWPRLRWAAAAAVVLLLGGGALMLWNIRDDTMPAAMAESAIAMTDTLTQMPAHHDEATVQTTAMAQATVAAFEPAPTATAAVPTPVVTEVMTEEAEHHEQQPANHPDIDDAPAVEPAHRPSPAISSKPGGSLVSVPGGSHAGSHAMTASLYTANSLTNVYSHSPVQMSNTMAQRFTATHNDETNAARLSPPVFLTDYEEYQHHHRPLSIGVKLSYPLTDRLSVSTGVVYTRLQSDFATVMKNNRVERQQTLHYVGLPVGLQYRLIDMGHFSLSAATCLEADWNFNSRLTTNHTTTDGSKDRCQWSLRGSLPLSYNITPQVALFAEIGISHYFDNHSTVQNYFKEHPTAFSLHVGVNVTLADR